jgi:hypothetical protein
MQNCVNDHKVRLALEEWVKKSVNQLVQLAICVDARGIAFLHPQRKILREKTGKCGARSPLATLLLAGPRERLVLEWSSCLFL